MGDLTGQLPGPKKPYANEFRTEKSAIAMPEKRLES
jgi:hypothetical protein